MLIASFIDLHLQADVFFEYIILNHPCSDFMDCNSSELS